MLGLLVQGCSDEPKGTLVPDLSAYLPTVDELPIQVLALYENSAVEIDRSFDGSELDWPVDFGFKSFAGLPAKKKPFATQELTFDLTLSRYASGSDARRALKARPLVKWIKSNLSKPVKEMLFPMEGFASANPLGLQWEARCFYPYHPTPRADEMRCDSIDAQVVICNWTLVIRINNRHVDPWVAADPEVPGIFNALAKVVMRNIGCTDPEDGVSIPPQTSNQ